MATMGVAAAGGFVGGLFAGDAIHSSRDSELAGERPDLHRKGWTIGGAVLGTSATAMAASLLAPYGSTTNLALLSGGLIGALFGAMGIAIASRPSDAHL